MKKEIEKLLREMRSSADQYVTDEWTDGYAACAGRAVRELEAILNRQNER